MDSGERAKTLTLPLNQIKGMCMTFHHFFNETIWAERIDTLPWFKRTCYRIARVGFIVFRGFTDERLNQQASALTYVSFLSIIPLMAVLFSLAKGFGFQGKVGDWFRDMLSLIDPEVLEQIISYVSNTQVTALGAIGFLVLLWTILKTLLNLERSFNQIWGVQHCRPLYRALAYYLSVVLVVPLLIAASTTLMAVLHTGKGGWLEWAAKIPGATFVLGFVDNFIPFLILWVAFSLVFSFMVNTNVRPLAAMGGAFITSLLWNLLQWIYIETQVGISKNAIYGTFAFLPIFLVYLYLSWLILLFGSRIAFALQNESAFRRDRIARVAGTRYRTSAGLLVLKQIADDFAKGKQTRKMNHLAERLDLPEPLVLDIVEHLVNAGILHRIAEGNGNNRGNRPVAPARALDQIKVSEVVRAIECNEGTIRMPDQAMTCSINKVLLNAEQAREAALEGVMVQDLVEK